jgi:hypothetical protein
VTPAKDGPVKPGHDEENGFRESRARLDPATLLSASLTNGVAPAVVVAFASRRFATFGPSPKKFRRGQNFSCMRGALP